MQVAFSKDVQPEIDSLPCFDAMLSQVIALIPTVKYGMFKVHLKLA